MGRFGENREQEVKSEYKKIFIFCEGEKTEPLYFKGFKEELEREIIRRKDAVIVIDGTGFNTLSLVKYATKNLPKEFDPNMDEKWVVFDEDSVPKGNFDNAIKKAISEGFKVAYSNECFELWYLLHFSYYDVDNGRDADFKNLMVKLKKLDPKIKITNWRKQGKKFDGIYSILKSEQSIAIKRAKILFASYNGEPLSQQKPSTTVYLLVESLNKLKK